MKTEDAFLHNLGSNVLALTRLFVRRNTVKHFTYTPISESKLPWHRANKREKKSCCREDLTYPFFLIVYIKFEKEEGGGKMKKKEKKEYCLYCVRVLVHRAASMIYLHCGSLSLDCY